VKRDKRWHETRMKNATGLGPRQRRQVQAMLGGGFAVIGKICFCKGVFLLAVLRLYCTFT